jgi:hypothetical protein
MNRENGLLLTSIAALFLATGAARAEPQMPAQYHGNWCWKAEAYNRCDGPDGMDAIFIGPDVFNANLHVQCTPLTITAIPDGHRIQARCAGEDVDANPGTYEERGEHIIYFEFELVRDQLVITELSEG